MNKRTAPWVSLLLVLLAALFVNLLAQRYKFRWDLTGDQRFTLGQATLDLIQGLPETATVTAFFTADLPPELAVARQDFQDLLVEFAERSGGKVVFEFVDPGSSAEVADHGRREGARASTPEARGTRRS